MFAIYTFHKLNTFEKCITVATSDAAVCPGIFPPPFQDSWHNPIPLHQVFCKTLEDQQALMICFLFLSQSILTAHQVVLKPLDKRNIVFTYVYVFDKVGLIDAFFRGVTSQKSYTFAG